MARFEGTAYRPLALRRRLRAELECGEKLIAWGVVQLNPTTLSGFGAAALSLIPVFGGLLVVAAATSEALRAMAVLTDERLLLLKIDQSAVKVRTIGAKKRWWDRRVVRKLIFDVGDRSADGADGADGAGVGVGVGGRAGRPGWGACSGFESGGAGVLASVPLDRVHVEVDAGWRKKRPMLMSMVRDASELFVVRIDLDRGVEPSTDSEEAWSGDDVEGGGAAEGERFVWELGKTGRQQKGRDRVRSGRRRRRVGGVDGGAGGGVHRARRAGPGFAKIRMLVRVSPGGGGLRLHEAFLTLAGEDFAAC